MQIFSLSQNSAKNLLKKVQRNLLKNLYNSDL